MAASPLKLSELAVGASATVLQYPQQDATFLRLRETGRRGGIPRDVADVRGSAAVVLAGFVH